MAPLVLGKVLPVKYDIYESEKITDQPTEMLFAKRRSIHNIDVVAFSSCGYASFFYLKKLLIWVATAFFLCGLGSFLFVLINLSKQLPSAEVQKTRVNMNARAAKALGAAKAPLLTFTHDASDAPDVEPNLELVVRATAPLPLEQAKAFVLPEPIPKTKRLPKPRAKRQSKSHVSRSRLKTEETKEKANKHFESCKQWVAQGDIQKGIIECEMAFALNQNKEAEQFLNQAQAKAEVFYIQGRALATLDAAGAKKHFTSAMMFAPSKSIWKKKAIEGIRGLAHNGL